MDPSLNNWGLCSATYCTDTGNIDVQQIDVIQPTKNTHKQVRQNSKDLDVANQLVTGAHAFIQGAQAVFVEVPVGSQSARSMAAYGVCIGIIGALKTMPVPFIEVTPTEVKMAAVGSKTASKTDMIDWALAQHPSANWPTQRKKGRLSVIYSKAEHMADAVAVIYAGIQLPTFNAMVSFSISTGQFKDANPT